MELNVVIKDMEEIISSLQTYLENPPSEAFAFIIKKDILYYETIRDSLVELKQRREADKWREDYIAERADEV